MAEKGGEGDRRPASSFRRAEQLDDLARPRVSPELRLLEHGPVVAHHFESAAARRDQLDGRLGEVLLDLGRQTGGSWLVVSDRAVFDRDAHSLAG